MEIWVLGTLEASHDGRALDVRGALPRKLLALLALTPGHEVDADRLIAGLWGDEPPGGAAATLHSHVARLRRCLLAPDLVRTGHHGYLLDVSPEEVDALLLEREVAHGARSLDEGRFDDASEVLSEALNLWRGTPYAEFPDCALLEAEAARLSTLRLDALECRISADLARPGVTPPVAELEALVHWHPLRESFWALLMCAQYRVGRQADALGSYQRVSAVLAEELGIDPGPELKELQRKILAQDPALETAETSPVLASRLDSQRYPEPVALAERSELLETLTGLHDETFAGTGRLALVHGEAGVGKSALVREWSRLASTRARVLWGACDPLSSPRPLGPLVDVAPHLEPRVGELLTSGERDGLFEATLAALASAGPVVLIIEDLHWADMSTLDLMRFLARRLGGTQVLAVATYRDDHLQPSDPLRVMLGDVASQPPVRHLEVPLLSAAAVSELAAGTGIDPEALHQETGGNAFFVTEVVAAGGSQLPRTVQDAVLARVHRLTPQARLALESAAVIGSRAEPSLLHAMPGATADAVDECVTSGMLRFVAPVYTFRHEIVRQSVLSGITPRRLGALHWQVLDRLRELPLSPRPYARLADHAAMSDDAEAILEFAIAAGDHAASLGSHREAASQYGRAMPYADLLSLDDRIELYDKRAYECQVGDDHAHAIEAWTRSVELLRGTGRDLELVDALMGLDQSYFTIGDNSPGTAFVDEAFVAVAGTDPSPQLAKTLARRGSHLFRNSQTAAAVPWLERGLAMARLVEDRRIEARAGSTLAFARFMLGDRSRAVEEIDEALQVAIDNDDHDSAGAIYQTAAALHWLALDLVEAHERMQEAERYTAEHDLTGHLMCVLATEITWKLDLGLWDEAMAQAYDLLYVRSTSRASRIDPLIAIGLVGARRGDRDDVWAYLDEARDHVAKSQNLNYQGFVAVGRGEVHLLAGDVDAVRSEALQWYEEAVHLQDEEILGDLAILVWRAGLIDAPPPGLREPEVLSMTGRHREAAAMWARAGAPYKAAWALLDSDDEADLREARARFDQLGAAVLVARCDDKLRSIGARVPRGARASTRSNVAGLTDREVDVLDLLDAGMRNADIAAKLHLSQKTVGHHVSAILAKLGASSRLEAVRRARDLRAVS